MNTLRIPKKKENMGILICCKCGKLILAKKVLFATMLRQNKILYNYHGIEGMKYFVKHGVKIQCSSCSLE
jgi:hypothetical protein